MGRTRIDLNADVGEGNPDIDQALMKVVTSVNIACGGHAGDDDSMNAACRLAVERGIRIGAHPSYPDRENFGRISMPIKHNVLVGLLVAQVERLGAIARDEGATVAYFKPHGALYNDTVTDDGIRGCMFSIVAQTELPVMLLGSISLARKPFILREGFIDRTYLPNGSLTPRSHPGALILDPGAAAAQALTFAPGVDSLCVHSDTPGAIALAGAARSALEEAGYIIGA